MCYADCIKNLTIICVKNKRNCFIYAAYRTRLNPVQDSVYRRWQILLVSSHTGLYVIWYLDLLSVCVYIDINPLILFWNAAWQSMYWSSRSVHGTASLFLNSSFQEVFMWLQDQGQQDSHLSTANLQMFVRFCASEGESQLVSFSLYLRKNCTSPLTFIFGSQCVCFCWGLN